MLDVMDELGYRLQWVTRYSMLLAPFQSPSLMSEVLVPFPSPLSCPPRPAQPMGHASQIDHGREVYYLRASSDMYI